MILIRGAEVYDPAHNINGQIQDLWVEGERIAPAPLEFSTPEVIDASGTILAPAGVEIHTHVAGEGLNDARRFLLGSGELLDLLTPPAETAARRYLSLGYTTVFDAASSSLMARATSNDLQQMEGLDRGTFTQLGDHRLLLQALAGGDRRKIRDTLAWLLHVSGGYAVKLVNPGGGIAWKAGLPAPGLDEPIGLGELTQRRIIQMLVQVVNEMGLPHPVHLHAGRLGRPGNAAAFCETARALEGQRAHLCHIQFYSYGQDQNGNFTSAAEQVVQCLEEYPQVTCDVGQVLFGTALAISFDTSGLSALQKVTGKPWISRQLEGEGGTNVLPLSYLARDASSAVQWATGLELLLRFPDPTRLFLTTDHPNGAPFTTYPQVIEWLMSRSARQEMLRRVNPAGTQKTGLGEIEREYRLDEIFAMTSWGPARALGLADRGHLGIGALADLRCYRKQENLQTMFAHPAWVMRRGRVVVQDGLLAAQDRSGLVVVRPEWDEDRRPRIEAALSDLVSVPVEEYGLGAGGQPGAKEVPCTSRVS
jgi:formylmethanofuran dehydrogenase subunit A